MKTINEYLDQIETKTGSDYAIAQKIGVSKQAISIIRKTGNVKEETAIKITDVLGIDRNEVVLAAMIARSNGEVKKTWMNISKQAGIAASVALASVMGLAFSSTGGFSTLSSFYYQVCILCKIDYCIIIGGTVLALGLILTTWSQKNGSIKENEFLPHPKQDHTKQQSSG